MEVPGVWLWVCIGDSPQGRKELDMTEATLQACAHWLREGEEVNHSSAEEGSQGINLDSPLSPSLEKNLFLFSTILSS